MIAKSMSQTRSRELLGLLRMRKIIVQLLKNVRVTVIIHNDVLAIHERSRVRRVHLVHKHQSTGSQRLERPEVALPMRWITSDDDLRSRMLLK